MSQLEGLINPEIPFDPSTATLPPFDDLADQVKPYIDDESQDWPYRDESTEWIRAKVCELVADFEKKHGVRIDHRLKYPGGPRHPYEHHRHATFWMIHSWVPDRGVACKERP